jgi:hypothetical protein
MRKDKIFTLVIAAGIVVAMALIMTAIEWNIR